MKNFVNDFFEKIDSKNDDAKVDEIHNDYLPLLQVILRTKLYEVHFKDDVNDSVRLNDIKDSWEAAVSIIIQVCHPDIIIENRENCTKFIEKLNKKAEEARIGNDSK